MYHRLFIFVEGPDDTRFFRHIMLPLLSTRFQSVQIVEYGGIPKQKIQALLSSIRKMGASYLFVADRDLNPCVTIKKEKLLTAIPELAAEKIVVVVQEIEGWYLSGVSSRDSKLLRLQWVNDTSVVTKERFNGMIPSRYDSRTDFMLEILRMFNLEEARRRSPSLQYFMTKHHVA